ncbi:hypothetical protein WUBG_11814 [Wuchereria bancrofti]|uniref:Uncharacterized protein n=1 Tax=Wuchereria bancrofti TaxID=6293 RepID=J9EPR0_WUCBA|nr:hypothetical protein WUBG_11814 [Wuchereria bancrofti]
MSQQNEDNNHSSPFNEKQNISTVYSLKTFVLAYVRTRARSRSHWFVSIVTQSCSLCRYSFLRDICHAVSHPPAIPVTTKKLRENCTAHGGIMCAVIIAVF